LIRKGGSSGKKPASPEMWGHVRWGGAKACLSNGGKEPGKKNDIGKRFAQERTQGKAINTNLRKRKEMKGGTIEGKSRRR